MVEHPYFVARRRTEAMKISEKRQRNVYEAMESGKFSDLTLCLQDGTEIKCHRVIVCTQCEFFDIAVKPGQFKESSGIIKLENDPPQAIRCLVDFLYTGKYNTTKHEDVEIEELPPNEYAEALHAHAQVYIVSVIYWVPDLQDLSSKFIKLALTDRSLDLFPSLFQAIDSGIPPAVCSLRKVLIEFAEEHVVELTSGDRFRNMVDMAPELMETLMHDLAKSREQARSNLENADRRIRELERKVSSDPKYRYKCPKCSEVFEMVMPAFHIRVGCPGCGVSRLTSSWGDLKMEDLWATSGDSNSTW